MEVIVVDGGKAEAAPQACRGGVGFRQQKVDVGRGDSLTHARSLDELEHRECRGRLPIGWERAGFRWESAGLN
jgi:hypothetical protein